MATTPSPPVLQSECANGSGYTVQPGFLVQYEKHLNDNLANYLDPEAHQGLSSDLNPVTGTGGSHMIRRGRKFWCGVALWSVILLGLICIGSLVMTGSLRKQKFENSNKGLGGSTTASIASSTMKQAASQTIWFYGISTVLSASAKDIHLSTRTATGPAQSTWIGPHTPYTSMASTPTRNVPSVSNQTAMQSISGFAISRVVSQALPMDTTMITGIHISGTSMPDTRTSTSISTVSVSPMASTSISLSSAPGLSSVSMTTRASTTEDTSKGTDTSGIRATHTSHGGLVGFCGTLGMACTEKIRRDSGVIAEEPAAIAILESALAMFSSTSMLSSSKSHETLMAAHSYPATTVEMPSFTTVMQIIASTPIPDPVSSTQSVRPISVGGPRSGTRVVGFCSVRGMACLK